MKQQNVQDRNSRFSFSNMVQYQLIIYKKFKGQKEKEAVAPVQTKSQILGSQTKKPIRAVALDNYKKIDLPMNFGQEILENDILFEIQENPSFDVAQRLTQLYMLGVEYYSSQKDEPRMKYFSNRLNYLMQSSKFFQSQQQIKQKEIDSVVKKAADENNIKQVLTSMHNDEKKLNEIVQQEITQQSQNIQKRLEERRNMSQNRQMGRAASQPQFDQQKVDQKQKQQIPIVNKDRSETKDRLDKEGRSIEERLNRFQKRDKRGSLLQDNFIGKLQIKKVKESLSAPKILQTLT